MRFDEDAKLYHKEIGKLSREVCKVSTAEPVKFYVGAHLCPEGSH